MGGAYTTFVFIMPLFSSKLVQSTYYGIIIPYYMLYKECWYCFVLSASLFLIFWNCATCFTVCDDVQVCQRIPRRLSVVILRLLFLYHWMDKFAHMDFFLRLGKNKARLHRKWGQYSASSERPQTTATTTIIYQLQTCEFIFNIIIHLYLATGSKFGSEVKI